MYQEKSPSGKSCKKVDNRDSNEYKVNTHQSPSSFSMGKYNEAIHKGLHNYFTSLE